jgi:hypothetical protein
MATGVRTVAAGGFGGGAVEELLCIGDGVLLMALHLHVGRCLNDARGRLALFLLTKLKVFMAIR